MNRLLYSQGLVILRECIPVPLRTWSTSRLLVLSEAFCLHLVMGDGMMSYAHVQQSYANAVLSCGRQQSQQTKVQIYTS